MLVLMRRVGENLKVFEEDDLESCELEISIIDIVGKQVHIGISAKKKYSILRDELYRKNCAEKDIKPVEDSYDKFVVIKRFELKNKRGITT